MEQDLELSLKEKDNECKKKLNQMELRIKTMQSEWEIVKAQNSRQIE